MSYFVCGHCQERTDIFGHGGGARMAEDLKIPFLGEVPMVLIGLALAGYLIYTQKVLG